MAENITLNFRVEGKRGMQQALQSVEGSLQGVESATMSTSGSVDSMGSTVLETTKGVAKWTAQHAAALVVLKGAEKAVMSNTAATAALNTNVAKITGAFTSATAAASRFTGGLKTAAKLMLGRFLPGIGLVLGAAGLQGLISKLTEFGAQASSVRPVTQAFDNLAAGVGTTGEALRKELSTAVSGTVPELELMKTSVIALNSEAIRSPRVLSELARASRILGRTVGKDTTEAFDNLVRGIGLMNPTLLKGLGVMVSVDEATRNWAEANNRAVGSLTDAERHHAFLVEVLDEVRAATGRVGDETNDLGTILQRSETSSINFRREMRSAVAEAEGIRDVNADWAEIQRILNEMGRDTLPGLAGGFADVVGELGQFVITDPIRRFLTGEMLDVGEKAWDLRIKQVRELGRAVNVLSATGPQGFGVEGQILLPPPTGGGIETPARPAIPGFESFLEMNERAIALTAELKREVQDIPAIDIRFGPQMAKLIRNPERIAGSLQFAETLTVPGTNLERRGRIRAPELEFDPGPVGDAAASFEDAGAVAVASFGAMAQAAIRGSEQMEVSLVRGITSIVQSLPGVGGFAGAAIGAVGGILASVIGSRDDTQSVRVDEYGPTARRQQREDSGPKFVTVQILGPDGEEISRTVRKIHQFEALDGVSRLPNGAPVTGGG